MNNPETEMSFRRRAWEFWRRNQVLILHLPAMVFFLFGTYIVLKSIDSRIGVEGFGDLFGYLLNLIHFHFNHSCYKINPCLPACSREAPTFPTHSNTRCGSAQ